MGIGVPFGPLEVFALLLHPGHVARHGLTSKCHMSFNITCFLCIYCAYYIARSHAVMVAVYWHMRWNVNKAGHCTCLRGDNSILRLLLDKVGIDPNSPHGREQHAPLHIAAKSGTAPCPHVRI